MVHDLRFGRFLKLSALVAAGVVATSALSACGGPDLGKENFARTTVPAAGDSGATSGPITDPAVAPAVLRDLLPCQFVDKTAMSPLGTMQGDATASSTQFDACVAKATDPGGKEIRASVEVGGIVTFASDKTTGAVGGLPQVEVPDLGGGSGCVVSALTARNPDFGVSFRIDYTGGDACAAGRKLVATAVEKLHNNPQKYVPGPGTLLAVDPCSVLDEAAVDGVVKGGKPRASGLHSCDWGLIPSVRVTMFPGIAPAEGDGWLKADVGTPNQAYAKQGTTSGSSCQVKWQHRQWKEDHVEVVQLEYSNSDAQADKDDPCGKTVGLAKQLAGKLPAA
ncbi:DUF3558 domain-containing protein [Amycolatopsis echigonensis]|uniref:DUF3558 domain-containing protein n=1 Tax=Amycolatopsis echigonensis TaxID=2576905 RepID=A0A2N3WLW0_9PSEU|nr:MULTISPECIES: hypothetical protein [Amycolatopsis]PKV94855.1 hypothetical protein ATK30_5743 [Amycolatopsis niigatensis]